MDERQGALVPGAKVVTGLTISHGEPLSGFAPRISLSFSVRLQQVSLLAMNRWMELNWPRSSIN